MDDAKPPRKLDDTAVFHKLQQVSEEQRRALPYAQRCQEMKRLLTAAEATLLETETYIMLDSDHEEPLRLHVRASREAVREMRDRLLDDPKCKPRLDSYFRK